VTRVAGRGAALRSFVEKCTGEGTITVPCFTCAHCSTIVEVPDETEERGFCVQCFYSVCIPCGALNRCTPFEKKIEAYENKMRFRASLGV